MYNSIADDANNLNGLEFSEPRKKILPIFKQLQEIFMGPIADDEADGKVEDQADHKANSDMDYETEEQPGTTDMPK